MSYEKKFDVGSVSIDKHYLHFIHELPLLSFADVQHSINVSLIFQSKESNNPFHISKGCKFNLQKRLIMNGNIPEKFEDGNGKLITLNNCSSRFVFDDGSQRIIRAENSTFVLENPDYSKEVYDALGKITEAWDKYGHKYLTYVYVGNHLDCINYRNKTIRFNYSGSPMTLNSLQYVCNDETICTTTFSYPEEGSIIVHHYSGVDYHLTYSSGGLDACSIDTDVAYSTQKPYRLRCERSIKTSNSMELKVFKQVGTTVIDETKYELFICDGVNAFDVLDVTDYNGVKMRMQIKDDKPVYSYEVSDDMIRENPNPDDYIPPYTCYSSVTYHSNDQDTSALEQGDSIQMLYDRNLNRWWYTFYPTIDVKQVMVSGWIRKNFDSNVSFNPIDLTFSDLTDVNESYSFDNLPLGRWVYFSDKISLSKLDSPTINFYSCNSSQLSSADFRITPYYEKDSDNSSQIPAKENVLIAKDPNGKEVSISLDSEIIFYNGDTVIDKNIYDITAKDIIRYKINEGYGAHTNEIYFNNCRGVIPNAGEFKVKYYDGNRGTFIVNVKNVAVEKRYSRNGNIYATRVDVSLNSADNYALITQSLKNGSCYKEARYDIHHLDLLVSKNEQVETSYVRNNCGLITSQTIADDEGAELCTTYTSYDEACTKVVSTTDEFDQVTNYVTDDVWGVVTEVHLCDGTTIKNYYDEDMSTLRHKLFCNGNKEKAHNLIYSEEGGLEIVYDTLQYTYETGWGVNREEYIKKLGVPIESHTISMADRTFEDAYPNRWLPEYTHSGSFDKYGRVTKIDGLLENTYGLSPIYVPGEGGSQGQYVFSNINNSNSQLAKSKDLTTQKVTKYAYEKGRVSRIGEFDNNALVSEEMFTCDDIGRLVKDEYTYAGGKKVIGEIAYKKNANHPLADNTVSTYTYKVNSTDTVAAQTENTYDSFKRITNKKVSLASATKQINKQVNYNTTRVTDVQESFGDENIGKTEYLYDPLGRITQNTYVSDTTASQETTYQYDEFGQLIRENNKALDKTFVYEYNSIGNITCVKEYDYYAPEEALPGCYKSVVYEYDAECPDKLTKFDGNEIEYNSIGCPSKYKDASYEWKNGKLSKIHRSTFIRDEECYATRTFTYDGYGRRTQKHYVFGVNYSGADAVNNYSSSVTNNYTYDNNGRLIRELRTEQSSSGTVHTMQEFVYMYDESGIIGVMYSINGSTLQPYYYHRNLQGDVIAIYDANGNKQAEYAYDAWGNCEVVYDDPHSLAYDNPIRYRGYYYDTETKLYYLNARYYSPEWRRFISPDRFEYIDVDTPNGLNLYLYCNNDPVNKYDPTGHITISLIVGLVVSFAIGTSASAISQYVQYGEVNWFQAGVDGLFAVTSTALAYTGIGLIGSIAAGAGMGLAQYTLDSAVFHDDFTWSGALIATSLGALGGLASGRGAQHFKSIGSNLDETGRTGVKAILTAFDKYGTGAGYQKVMNLWGGRVANSLEKSISQNFTKSALIIWGTTAAIYGASYWLGKINWGF